LRENFSQHGRDFSSASDQIDKSLIHEVQILYRLLPATQWVDIAAVALVFGLLMNYVDLPSLFVWALFVIAIISIRISITERYNTVTLSPENVNIWFNWFLLGITLYGAMWSVTAILLVPSEIPTAAAFTAVVLCGLAAAGVAVSSVNLKAFTVFMLAILWPYSFYLLASGATPQTIIGGLVFLFSFVIFVMGLRTNHFFANMVNLELKSDTLEQDLKYEIRKRNLVENALLDNTLEEELADRIRQQSLALKEGTLRKNPNLETIRQELTESQQMLQTKIMSQLQNVLVLVRDLKNSKLAETSKKQIKIIDTILTSIVSSITKSAVNEENVRQELLAIDFDSNEYEPVNIRRTINYLVDAIPLVHKAKYITINRNIDTEIPNIVYGNKKALNKILSNLINNAVKHSDGGTVNITIEPLESRPGQLELRFAVVDTGVGMPAEAISFLQKDQIENAGLYPGLAVIKHLVNKHGSNLLVKSTLGVGTEIEFLIKFRTDMLATA